MPSEFPFPEAVLVRSGRHGTLAGLGPELVYSFTSPTVFRWFEAGHLRSVEVKEVLADTESHFVFATLDGDTFALEPLTLASYRSQVRPHTAGRPDFATLAEMIEAMRLEW